MSKKSKPPMSHAKMVKLGKIRHKSLIKSPVALAWEIYSRNPHLQRRDAMNLAMAAGLAFYTARSQYQAWKSAGDNDKQAKLKSNALMERMGLKAAK